jgi:creatinine amidohydrolase/Fe(II)-dependent formamide hydrolase-like protein
VLGSPTLATAEKGARIFRRWVEALARAVEAEGLREGFAPNHEGEARVEKA